ncbi:MAG: DUF1846 domain-containing protein [Spirochaetia bacterium]
MKTFGFDNQLYLEHQTAAIKERVSRFDRLYVECGGKLIDDQHAARVLPGYQSDNKVQIMKSLGDDLEVVVCIYAGDIASRKVRGGFGLAYDVYTLDLLSRLSTLGIYVKNVVITRYKHESVANNFAKSLTSRGYVVTFHQEIDGYPHDVDRIVSPQGLGMNPYIETTRPIVLVAAPGPGSGKLGTCLGQLYHEHQRKQKVGYAKFESFPVWNLPLNHPLNIAYEAATAELLDRNMIDPFHFQAYNEVCINYNRDIDAFPVLKSLLEKLTGSPSFYCSPTDMGVNRIKDGIVDGEKVCEACCQEVVFRYFSYAYEVAMGQCNPQALRHLEQLLFTLEIRPESRRVVPIARAAVQNAKEQSNKGDKGVYCAGALELPDGRIITGKNSSWLHAASALILNAVKTLSGIKDEQYLLPEEILEQISFLKRDLFRDQRMSLDLEEMLIALASASVNNEKIRQVMQHLSSLKGCHLHLTYPPSPGDATGLRKLGLHTTCDA